MPITKEMSIAETVRQYPQAAQVFMNYGMGCLGCAAAQFENIEQGAIVHGIEVEALLQALNQSIQK